MAKRKSASRSAAARKAARTRAANKRKRSLAAKKGAAKRRRKRPTRTVAKRRRRTTKAVAPKRRRRRARRNPRGTAAQVRKYQAIRRRGTNLRRKSPKRTRYARKRVVKALPRARRTIKYQKAYGSSASRRFMAHHKIRSNPMGAIVDSIKRAIPVAASMYGGKILGSKLLPMIPGLDRLGQHSAPVGSVLILAAGAFATKRGPLAKWRQDIMLGLGINTFDTILRTYMPTDVKTMIGLSGDEDIYDGALEDYVQVDNYGGVGDYIEVGADEGYSTSLNDYVEVGAEADLGIEEELGLEEAMGIEQEMGAVQIGAGIGSGGRTADMVRRVPTRSFTAPVPSRSFVRKVPQITSGYDKLPKLYTGIFSGGYGC